MIDAHVDYCPDECHNYWRDRAEKAEAERDVAIHNGTAAQLRFEQAEADQLREIIGDHLAAEQQLQDELARYRAVVDAARQQELGLGKGRDYAPCILAVNDAVRALDEEGEQ